MAKSIFDESRVVDTYPIIVVGAGLGGLGAACQLALVRKKVLLLEKHNVPGGFATSFVRGRFEFEGALHELDGIGSPENKGSLYDFLEKLGVLPDKLELKQVPEFYRSVFFDGYDETIPFGLEAYTEKFIELFPHEKEGIEGFMEVCKAVRAGIDYIRGKQGKYTQQEILKEHPWLARVPALTLLELFNRFFKDKRLIAVIGQLWGYVGVPPSRVNAFIYIAMIMSYLKYGAAFPAGRSHALTTSLVKAVEELGGTVRLNALVNRILVDDGKVCGVELLNGDIYRCKVVISNVNPICTAMKMLPEDVVPESYMKSIYAPEIGPSAISVYLGLNATPKELGLNAHETFINEDDDLNNAFSSFHKLEPPKYMVAACYNHIYEEISPPGTTQLVLTSLQMGKLWQNVAPDQYFSIKDKMGDKMVDIVEKTISPNIRDYIEVAEVATPLTYYRYSKNIEGAIYGYTQDILNGPNFRLKSRGAIPGLYQVGAWTNFGGGYSTTLLSGRLAAGMLLDDIKKGTVSI